MIYRVARNIGDGNYASATTSRAPGNVPYSVDNVWECPTSISASRRMGWPELIFPSLIRAFRGSHSRWHGRRSGLNCCLASQAEGEPCCTVAAAWVAPARLQRCC